MCKYALLQNPGHNRVYFNASLKLSKSELFFFSVKLSVPLREIREEVFGGVEYITFKTPDGLSPSDMLLLSRLSFTYAIFQVKTYENRQVFLPVQKNGSYYFGDDLNTILKYSGKTNEIFTRMMINLAVFASCFDYADTLNLLDPVCGKGTAMFEGLICGYNSFGVELSEKLVDESYHYLKKYLENGKYKHELKKESVGGKNKNNSPFKSKRYLFDIAKNKDDRKNNKSLIFEIIEGDTENTDKFYKKNTFNIIVADLPYGVQHSNTAKGNTMRNPLDLLESSLPAWLDTLKTGGAIVLAWNTFLLKKADIERIFCENGLTLPDYNGGENKIDFEHRVDQAINRDIIIGVKN
jgi:hypothetical protein